MKSRTFHSLCYSWWLSFSLPYLFGGVTGGITDDLQISSRTNPLPAHISSLVHVVFPKSLSSLTSAPPSPGLVVQQPATYAFPQAKVPETLSTEKNEGQMSSSSGAEQTSAFTTAFPFLTDTVFLFPNHSRGSNRSSSVLRRDGGGLRLQLRPANDLVQLRTKDILRASNHEVKPKPDVFSSRIINVGYDSTESPLLDHNIAENEVRYPINSTIPTISFTKSFIAPQQQLSLPSTPEPVPSASSSRSGPQSLFPRLKCRPSVLQSCTTTTTETVMQAAASTIASQIVAAPFVKPLEQDIQETQVITADQIGGARPTQMPFHFTTTKPEPTTTTTRRPASNPRHSHAGNLPNGKQKSPHNHVYAPTQDPFSVDHNETDIRPEDFDDYRAAHLTFGSKVKPGQENEVPPIPSKQQSTASSKKQRPIPPQTAVAPSPPPPPPTTTTLSPISRFFQSDDDHNDEVLPFYKESGGVFEYPNYSNSHLQPNEIHFDNKIPNIKYAPKAKNADQESSRPEHQSVHPSKKNAYASHSSPPAKKENRYSKQSSFRDRPRNADVGVSRHHQPVSNHNEEEQEDEEEDDRRSYKASSKAQPSRKPKNPPPPRVSHHDEEEEEEEIPVTKKPAVFFYPQDARTRDPYQHESKRPPPRHDPGSDNYYGSPVNKDSSAESNERPSSKRNKVPPARVEEEHEEEHEEPPNPPPPRVSRPRNPYPPVQDEPFDFQQERPRVRGPPHHSVEQFQPDYNRQQPVYTEPAGRGGQQLFSPIPRFNHPNIAIGRGRDPPVAPEYESGFVPIANPTRGYPGSQRPRHPAPEAEYANEPYENYNGRRPPNRGSSRDRDRENDDSSSGYRDDPDYDFPRREAPSRQNSDRHATRQPFREQQAPVYGNQDYLEPNQHGQYNQRPVPHLDPIYTRTLKQYDDEHRGRRPQHNNEEQEEPEQDDATQNENDDTRPAANDSEDHEEEEEPPPRKSSRNRQQERRREEESEDHPEEEEDDEASESSRKPVPETDQDEADERSDSEQPEENQREEEREEPEQEQEAEEEEEEEEEEDPNKPRPKQSRESKKPPPKRPKQEEKSGDLDDDISGIEREFGHLGLGGFDGDPGRGQVKYHPVLG